jgi:TolB-like protein
VADGVSAELARTMTRVFAEELTRSSGWDISTPQEIAALLSDDQQQLVECDGKPACAADLGKALGADRLVSGTVRRQGEHYIVEVALLKLPEATVERRISRDAEESASIRAAANELAHP